jgi:hypothetical protein
MMKIGLDIDNSILDYSRPLALAAFGILGLKLPRGVTKQKAKLIIVNHAGEPAWTRLQGEIYGDYSRFSSLYAGLTNFLVRLWEVGHQPILISHKTQFAIAGGKTDLRQHAMLNLDRLGLFGLREDFIVPDQVIFCETEEQKIREIDTSGVSVFIDDLAKVLVRISSRVEGIHIHCDGDHEHEHFFRCVNSWDEIQCESLERR